MTRPTVARRSWRQSAHDGWHLGGAALSLVRGQPGLRRYLVPALVVLLVLHIVAVVEILHYRHQVTIPQRILFALVFGYVDAVLTNAAAVGLAGLSDQIIGGGAPRAADGWRLAVRRLPQVAGWGLIVIAVGIPARLLTSWGVDQLAVLVLGFGWGVISFFAIPAIALTGAGPLRAARRSLHLVRGFWAGQIAGTVYVWLRPALFLGLPARLLLVVGVALERNGFDFLGWTLALGGVVVLAIAYLVMVSGSRSSASRSFATPRTAWRPSPSRPSGCNG